MGAHRIIAPVAAGLLLVGVFGAPADANVRTFKDRRGDADGSIDITRIRVDNATRQPADVTVRVKQRRFRIGDSIRIYLDTSAADRGPEYRLTGHYASEYSLRRMKTWTKAGREARCFRYSLSLRDRGVSTAFINRRCLGKSDRVRVAVETSRRGHATDWARSRHRWLGWVKR